MTDQTAPKASENAPMAHPSESCEHHWGAHHYPGTRIYWITTCTRCGTLNVADFNEQIDALVKAIEEQEAARAAPDPEWLTSLRRDMGANLGDAMKSWASLDRREDIAHRATILAGRYLRRLHGELSTRIAELEVGEEADLARIAELEENVRAIGGDPDRMVDPRDHEAAIAAMQREMALAATDGTVDVTRAAAIAGEHMLRMAQALAPDESIFHGPDCNDGLPTNIGDSTHVCTGCADAPGSEVQFLRDEVAELREREVTTRRAADRKALIVSQTLGKALGCPPLTERAAMSVVDEGTVNTGDSTPESLAEDAAALIGELRGYLTAARGPAPEVHEVPAGEAREGDTVTIVGQFRKPLGEVKATEIYVDPSPSFSPDGPYVLSDATVTVSRPVSPLPDQPGAVGTATVRGVKGVTVFRTDDDNGPMHWTSAVLVNGQRWFEDDDVTDFRPPGAGVDEGGKP